MLSCSTMWSLKECHRLNLMQALRFYGSFNVVVAGITIVNSSQCHLKFDNCQGVMVHDLTISSPENSLNTDGIHLQNSKDVSIHHTNLACGNSLILTVCLRGCLNALELIFSG
uniref:Pectin lyase-like superfamily protein n=1 Tax=Zea mays TaxID=4577 RepID=C4IYV2_MAIZE|nr:unknown [Zea mays]